MHPDTEQTPWRILVVDDEEGIHGITRMVFRGYRFENRPIELISALSGGEAREILQSTPDIALILLDVVMESDDEGLRLIDFVRNTLGNQDVRIILRTGHPGCAPETEVIVDYDINDYLSKAELSASRLLTSVVVALRSYRDIESARRPSPTGSQSQTSDQQLLQQLGRQLRGQIEECQRQGRRLQQQELGPMVRDLLGNLDAGHSRIRNACLMLDEIPAPLLQLEVADIRQLPEQLSAILLPEARRRDWLLDYRLQPEMPERLRLAAGAALQLWLALTEYAVSRSEGGDLRLQLGYSCDDQRLQLSISSAATISEQGKTDDWDRHRLQQAERLCQRLGGRLSLAEPGIAGELLSCSLPAEPVA